MLGSTRTGKFSRCTVRLAAASLVLGGIAAAAAAPPRAEPNVVVTIKPVHGLVARVMEGVGTPVLLVGGSASPHTFALKPSDTRALHASNLFIRVSSQVEPFTEKIMASLPKSVRVITLADAAGVELLAKRTGETFESHAHGHDDDHDKDEHGHEDKHGHHEGSEDHDGHDEHARSGDDDRESRDGHVWLDPRNAKAMVAAVAQALVEVSPGDSEKLKSNAERLLAEIDELEAELAASLQAVKPRPFVVFHDAYQYFERRFGLTAVGSITVSPDVKPSAKRLAEIRRKIAALDTACVFAEPNFSPRIVGAVTEGTSAKSGTLDPEGASIKEGPNSYFDLMRGLATGLKACLQLGS